MKKLFAPIVVASLLASGCMTSPTTGKTVPDIARIARVTQQAAAVTTREVLFNNPDLRDKFQLVADQLAVLEDQPELTVETMLHIVSLLPVKQLKSREAIVAFDVANMTIAAAGWSNVKIVQAEQVRPVISAIRAGILTGLDTSAPLP